MNNITVFTVFSQYCTVFTQYFYCTFKNSPLPLPQKKGNLTKNEIRKCRKAMLEHF